MKHGFRAAMMLLPLCLATLFRICSPLPVHNAGLPFGTPMMDMSSIQYGPMPYPPEVMRQRRSEMKYVSRLPAPINGVQGTDMDRRIVTASVVPALPLADPSVVAWSADPSRNAVDRPDRISAALTAANPNKGRLETVKNRKVKPAVRLYKLPYRDPRTGRFRDMESIEEVTFIDPRFSRSSSSYYYASDYDYEYYSEPSSESAPLELRRLYGYPSVENDHLDHDEGIRSRPANGVQLLEPSGGPEQRGYNLLGDFFSANNALQPPPFVPNAKVHEDFKRTKEDIRKIRRNFPNAPLKGDIMDYPEAIYRQYNPLPRESPVMREHGFNTYPNVPAGLPPPQAMNMGQMEQLVDAQYQAMGRDYWPR